MAHELIYKYFSPNEYSLMSLTNRKLWFSKPSDFNDPFDCQISSMTCREPTCDGCHKSGGFECNHILKALRELNLSEQERHGLAIKTNQEVECARVCCFSTKKDDILMWSHYADYHKGFCLGFACDTLFDGIKTHDVEYQEKSPLDELEHSLQACEDDDGVNRTAPDIVTLAFKNAILKTKYIEWEYESEKRAIYYDTESTMEKQGGIPFSPNSLREVIFGHKISEVYKSSIMNIMKHPDFNSTLLFQAGRSPFDYSLKLEPLPAMK